jgi:hypothetical protein
VSTCQFHRQWAVCHPGHRRIPRDRCFFPRLEEQLLNDNSSQPSMSLIYRTHRRCNNNQLGKPRTGLNPLDRSRRPQCRYRRGRQLGRKCQLGSSAGLGSLRGKMCHLDRHSKNLVGTQGTHPCLRLGNTHLVGKSCSHLLGNRSPLSKAYQSCSHLASDR